jgi:outer membrane immunogenic protein
MKKFAVATALVCLSGVAHAKDFTGARAEARIGWETPTVSGDGEVYKIGQAVSFGGEVGFDIAAGKSVVVGPYATYEFSGVELCDGGDCLSERGNLGAGGRIGFVLSPKALVYAKLGYANIDMKASSGSLSASESEGGVQGALGVDFGLAKSVYGFVELNYADYGKFYGINLQRRHVAGGLGVRF